ncbi:MAG TPA: DUF1080 domain-containing protein [Fimbriimonas sp.]
MSESEIYGRWDLKVEHPQGEFPSWVEIKPDGGSFVGQVGSARPITSVNVDGAKVRFSLPKQYEQRTTDLLFEGAVENGSLQGSCLSDSGEMVRFVGSRAPALPKPDPVRWGEPIELIGSDLTNWTPRSPNWTNSWIIQNGQLVNTAVGSDLVTKDRFQDFKLVAEYSYPEGSNSGIYLRGRYELQILDDHGKQPTVGSSGAIYGFLVPSSNAAKAANEWNTMEITLLGRFVTVVLNGSTIIEDREIPGITGGALDSDEGMPGPLFVQGDHGPVSFRRMTLTPAL